MTAMLMLAMVQWGFLTGVIANAKNRNAAGWFALGAALPLLGLALAIVVSSQPRIAEIPATKPRRVRRLAPAVA